MFFATNGCYALPGFLRRSRNYVAVAAARKSTAIHGLFVQNSEEWPPKLQQKTQPLVDALVVWRQSSIASRWARLGVNE